MELTNSQVEVLKRINKNLEKGDIRTIAANTNLSREYVGKVLSPFTNNYNEGIVNAAIELIAVREQGRKHRLQKLPA